MHRRRQSFAISVLLLLLLFLDLQLLLATVCHAPANSGHAARHGDTRRTVRQNARRGYGLRVYLRRFRKRGGSQARQRSRQTSVGQRHRRKSTLRNDRRRRHALFARGIYHTMAGGRDH